MKMGVHSALAALLTGGLMFASVAQAKTEIDLTPPPEGSVSVEEGLAAWARIFEVTSHPRCSNCHVGSSQRPMWSGPSYGKTRVHGMNVLAGESRIGAETIPCSTCHTVSERGNQTPHNAPRVGFSWQLAPVEADWFGRTSADVCAQLADPARNGGRSFQELANHLDHDVILRWAWEPGGGREPAPYSLQEHVRDVLAWGVAGQPCPDS